MFGDFPDLHDMGVGIHPPTPRKKATVTTTDPTPTERPPLRPARTVTADEMHMVRQMDDAVADLVDIVRDHAGICPVRPVGVCMGEAVQLLAVMPPRMWFEMLCQAAVREATYRGKTPPYVHALLDAYMAGTPVDFGKAYVPADVRDRLENAAAAGNIRAVPAT